MHRHRTTRRAATDHRRRARQIVLAASTTALAAAGLAGTASAAPTTTPDASANYSFQNVINNQDPTFNQALGINDSGQIAGYFGSGQPGHPNKGYVVGAPYGQGNFTSENFPNSAQTQVTGLNNEGDTVGFWVNGKGANRGFYRLHGQQQFVKVVFPTHDNAHPKFDQLLGINDHQVTVGFYNDGAGTPHGFTYDISSKQFHTVNVAGDTGITATAINNEGDVAGFATNATGTTEAFLKRSDGHVFHLNVPGASATQAFGVNDGDEVVGDYTVGSGSSAQTFGFAWVPGLGFSTINDPNGIGSTTLNGVNDQGSVVGFYTDAAGNTDGLVATAAG